MLSKLVATEPTADYNDERAEVTDDDNDANSVIIEAVAEAIPAVTVVEITSREITFPSSVVMPEAVESILVYTELIAVYEELTIEFEEDSTRMQFVPVN